VSEDGTKSSPPDLTIIPEAELAVPMHRLIPAIAAALLAGAAAAADGPRTPARFEHEDRALGALIRFPELKGDTTGRLRCASQVSRSGDVEKTGCYLVEQGDQVFITEIVKAAQKARMTPAIIDGRPAAVYVQFRVEMEQKGDERTIRILNNPGLEEMIDAYGQDHVAAQRELTDEDWMRECPRRTPFLVWAKAHVNEAGRQSSISVVPGDGPPVTERCQSAIVATLQESRFTPAFADGEPVPSSFIEPFGN